MAVGVLSILGKVTGETASSTDRFLAMKYNNAILRQKEQMAGFARADALDRGQQAAAAVRADGQRVASSAVAALGASGVDANVGSAAGIPASSIVATEADATLIEAQAAREAWGYDQQAAAFRQERRHNRFTTKRKNLQSLLGLS